MEKILSNDEMMDLVKLKEENPEEYKKKLRGIAGVLKDIADIVDEVHKEK